MSEALALYPSESPAARLFEAIVDPTLRSRALEILSAKSASVDERERIFSDFMRQHPHLATVSREIQDDFNVLQQTIAQKTEWLNWSNMKETAKQTWEVAKKYKWWIAGAAAASVIGVGFYTGAIPQAYVGLKAWLATQAWAQSIGSAAVNGWNSIVGSDIVGTAAETMHSVQEAIPNIDLPTIAPSVPTPIDTMVIPQNPVELWEGVIDGASSL